MKEQHMKNNEEYTIELLLKFPNHVHYALFSNDIYFLLTEQEMDDLLNKGISLLQTEIFDKNLTLHLDGDDYKRFARLCTNFIEGLDKNGNCMFLSMHTHDRSLAALLSVSLNSDSYVVYNDRIVNYIRNDVNYFHYKNKPDERIPTPYISFASNEFNLSFKKNLSDDRFMEVAICGNMKLFFTTEKMKVKIDVDHVKYNEINKMMNVLFEYAFVYSVGRYKDLLMCNNIKVSTLDKFYNLETLKNMHVFSNVVNPSEKELMRFLLLDK